MQNEEQKTHKDIIADMIRQYKSTEEDLTMTATKLSSTIDDNKLKIEALEKKKAEVLADKAAEEEKKNSMIKDLTQQIQNMTSSFSRMLTETLNKMKDRISAANQQWEEENEKKERFSIENIVNPGQNHQ